MKWSWKLGKVAGIDIQIHATFLLLLIWIGLASYQHNQNLGAAFSGMAFILAVFATVVLHELSHALTARAFGIRTKNILLLPIGGIAQMERVPEKPLEGLLVSLAGPAVNLLIAALLFVLLTLTGASSEFRSGPLLQGSFLARFLWVNVAIAVFNLLPAFPMDGGRVLRSLLAFWMSPLKATQIAATLGQLMVVFFFFIGLFYNPFLILIALFIGMGATAEASMAKVKAGTAGLTVKQAMITDFQTLSPDDTLQRGIDYVLAGFQQDFPVVEAGILRGMLSQSDLLKALAQGGSQTPVRQAMSEKFETARVDEALDEVFTRLQTSGTRAMPVMEGEKIAGILTTENIGELLMIQAALDRRSSTAL